MIINWATKIKMIRCSSLRLWRSRTRATPRWATTGWIRTQSQRITSNRDSGRPKGTNCCSRVSELALSRIIYTTWCNKTWIRATTLKVCLLTSRINSMGTECSSLSRTRCQVIIRWSKDIVNQACSRRTSSRERPLSFRTRKIWSMMGPIRLSLSS